MSCGLASPSYRVLQRALGVLACCLGLWSSACGSDAASKGADGGAADGDSGPAADGGSGSGGAAGETAGKGGTGAAGEAGSSGDAANGGSGGSGTGNAGSGNAGSGGDQDAGANGPGINTQGEVFCVLDHAAASFYFGLRKQCVISDKVSGDFTADELKAVKYGCTSAPGTLVDKCPDDETVAYCDGVSGVMTPIHETHLIYKTDVNPSADVVARDVGAVCQILPAYDASSDHPLKSQCKGTFQAKVDGKLVDFSKNLTCAFKTDGTQQSMLISGSDSKSSPDAKSMNFYVLKKGSDYSLMNELNQPGYGYIEGGTNAFVIATTGSMPKYTSSSFAADGASMKGTFDLGSLGKSASATGAEARKISDGQVDITLDVL